MKFLTNELDAPDIPERFLQNHEDGKVVFFCGAGISYSAELPGFGGLVEQVYENLGFQLRNQIQQIAFKNHQYDVAISLLESEILGGRGRVRKQIAEILSSPTINEKTTIMHKSLLTLSKNKDGKLRIVTTNFDRIFEQVIKETGIAGDCFVAPALPIANEEWDGIVYLHGLLCEDQESEKNESIIVSSGDFGQAYLIDRWAARFLGQLFKGFSVCFIGYSLEDPVVRYMTDAIAAARLQGKNPPEMFAFCAYKASGKNEIVSRWKSKGVTPIPYNQKKKHSLLQETLKLWSITYQEGWQGKISVVRSLIGKKPFPSTAEDDIVRKMIWALCDPTGKPAEIFAKATPVFSLAWLSAFCEKHYSSEDLAIFSIQKTCDRKFEAEYTFLSRPYTDVQEPPKMSLVSNNLFWIENDKVMKWMGDWLVRHLNNPALIVWVSQRGGVLHPEFRRLIIDRLNWISGLEIEGQTEELIREKIKSPDGIPDGAMTSLWELALSGKLSIPIEGYLIILTCNHIKKNGLDSSAKRLLLKALSPTVILKELPKYRFESFCENETRAMGNLIDSEVVVCDQAISFVEIVKNFPRWKECLPDLVVDFSLLLKEAMDLQKKLGKISDDSDYTYINIDSINDIKDRKARNSWIFLVKLVRDSWQELDLKRADYANVIIKLWWNYPYPIFKRLVFFALSKRNTFEIEQIVQWFMENSGKWLWSHETQFEVLQLMKKIATICTQNEIERVVYLLLEAIPEEFSKIDVETLIKEEYYARATWLRLGVIKKASAYGLGNLAEKRFKEIVEKYQLPEVIDEEDEYPVRVSMAIDTEFAFIELPRDPEALYIKIRDNQKRKNWEIDDWKSLCKDELDLVLKVLLRLNESGFESYRWWDSAFANWADDKIVEESWKSLSEKLKLFSDDFFSACSYGLSRWLQAISRNELINDHLFIFLVNKTINHSPVVSSIGKDFVTSAINHPVGVCTTALLDWWFNKKPTDMELLPINIKYQLTTICTQIKEEYIHGKVILASRIIALFRVDPEWTKEYLLPLFNWSAEGDAATAVWQGFMWNPRITLPFLYEIKKDLLQTAIHRNELGLSSNNYIRLITDIGIHKPEFFTYKEIASIISQFDTEELILVSDYMKEFVEGSGDKLEEIWEHRLYKFFHYCWPKNMSQLDENISQTIALICIKSGDFFENVYHEMQFSISAIRYPDYVLKELEETKLCEKFPKTTLFFIDKLISSDSMLISTSLRSCLDKIINKDPLLNAHVIFQRLDSLV